MRRTHNPQAGFTLIELLIAVLVVGILAAIALPALNKQRERAKDSAAQQSLEAGLRAAKAVHADGESFPSASLDQIMGRAERSQTFASASSFPASAGTVNVERLDASRMILRSRSASGRQFALSIDENTSRVRRYSPPQDSAAGTVFTATNLVRNPSLETGNTTGWVIANTPDSSGVETGWAAEGRYSLRFTKNLPNSYVYVYAASVPVVGNQRYSADATANILSLPPGGFAYMSINWYDGSWNPLRQDAGSRTYRLGVQRVPALIVDSPAGSAYAHVSFLISTSASPGLADAYVDAIQLAPTASASSSVPVPYVDGDQPGASWSGGAHNSSSTGMAGTSGW